MAGSGTISANGGGGNNRGGGGGGGRVALYYTTKTFNGTLSAYGGNDGSDGNAVAGGCGTIYQKPSGQTYGDLLIDNNDITDAENNSAQLIDGAYTFATITHQNQGQFEITSGVTLNSSTNLTITGDSTGAVFTTGSHAIGADLTIQNGGILSHKANGSSETYKLTLTVNNLDVQSGGAISANNRGYADHYGTGTPASDTNDFGPGAGYGGEGGQAHSSYQGGSIYGSVSAPTNLGSGGKGTTSSGHGGGAIQITASSGTITVNGTISANGQSPTSVKAGGGSGGSVYLTCTTLAGGGTISANGGSGYASSSAGGGGGGRVALYYTTKTFNGTLSSYGGNDGTSSSAVAGGCGTIYQKPSGQTYGDLLIDNNDITDEGQNSAQLTDGTYNFNTITHQNSGQLDITSGVTINPSAGLTIAGDSTGAVCIHGSQTIGGDLTIQNGGILGHRSNSTAETYKLTLGVSGNIDVQSGGAISANNRGYADHYGTGTPASDTNDFGPGAGYGGEGGQAHSSYQGGSIYGSVSAPTNLGSGGKGTTSSGHGGGAIQITASSGTITVNGTISANGQSPTSVKAGGGSGGSVYLTCTTLAGGGTISANGGSGYASSSAGGGGGGRVALYYTTKTFNGTLSSYGGNDGTSSSAVAGGCGTIYQKPSGQTYGDLLIDNNDITDEGQNSAQLTDGTYNFNTITHQNSGQLDITSGVTINPSAGLTIAGDSTGAVCIHGSQTIGGDLTIQNGGILGHRSNSTAETYKLTLGVSGNIDVQSGGAIGTNGRGYADRYGTGAPASGTNDYGPGGGYGGAGGDAGAYTGGSTYGSVTAPVNIGSGAHGYSTAGHGGGAMQITASSGTITVGGTISANGNNATSQHGGGGSGGSVYLTCATLAGAGSITADGGNGINRGGGGGGGRIALYYTTKTFNGTLTVDGGAAGGSGNPGIAGTIFDSGDTDGPDFASFSPSASQPDTAIQISCSISDDESGVYDDATGSGGQGVYLKWGTSSGTWPNEVQMNGTSVDGDGNGTYTAISNVAGQDAGTTIYYKVYAYNNGTGTTTEGDEDPTVAAYRLQSISQEQSISVGDEVFSITVPSTVQTAGTAFEVTITAQDTYTGSVQTKTDYSGTANLTVEYIDPTSGTVSVTPTSVTSFSSGIKTVNLTYQDAGEIKIRATDSGDATFTGLSASSVTFEPSAFTVTIKNSSGTETASLTAGDSFTIEVTAVSSTGATCSNYDGTASVSTSYVSPTTGTKSVTPGIITITDGTATINTALFKDAQSITVTVTETATGTEGTSLIGTAQSGTSSSITFRPYNFVITLTTPPSSRTKYYTDEEFNMTVAAKDKLGNITKNYRGTISFTQVSGLDLPLSNYKFLARDAGSHTFTGVSGSSSGTYSIACKDTTTTTITGAKAVGIISGRIIIPDQSGSTGTITGTLYINNEDSNAIVTTDDSCVVTLVITESSANNSATLTESQVTVSSGEATFSIANTEGETVTVSATTSPSLPVTSGTFTFGSNSFSKFRVLYWREITHNMPTFDTQGMRFLRTPKNLSFHDLGAGSQVMSDGLTGAHMPFHRAMMAGMEGTSFAPKDQQDQSMKEGFFRHYLKEGQKDRDGEGKDTVSEDNTDDDEEVEGEEE